MSHSLPPSTDADATAAPATLRRRQLLQAGVWAAPVIVLAAAAPAAAASSMATIAIANTYATWVYDGNANRSAIVGAVQITAPSQTPQATVSGISLTIVVTGTAMADTDPINTSGAGWSYLSRSVTGGAYGSATFAFSYTGTITSGAGQTTTGASPTTTGVLNFTFPVAVAGIITSGTVVTFNASAPQANPTSAQTTLPN